MSNYNEYNAIYAFHPGYYVAEFTEELGIKTHELALRLGLSPRIVTLIINGKERITSDISHKLSAMTGTSAELWLGLQAEYDNNIQQINQEQQLEGQREVEKGLDYQYFEKVAGLPHTRLWRERIINLCSYLNVSDLRILGKQNIVINFRKGIKHLDTQKMVNAQAWVQTAVNIARAYPVGVAQLHILEAKLPEIREMTLKAPTEFLPAIIRIFKESGVSFILLPYLKNSCINGAVKWLDNEHVLLAINDRRCYADTFWFSLFHEIRHILQKKVQNVFLSCTHNDNISSIDEELERDADKFARDYLIPPKEYAIFEKSNNFLEADIRKFAQEVHIHPGVLVGRLQHDRHIAPSQYNQFREKYKIQGRYSGRREEL